MRIRAIWIFLAVIGATIAGLIFFIQSTYFADILKHFAKRYMPPDIGIESDFTELAVKMIPPGVVIKNPVLKFGQDNPAGLPAGTTVKAEALDVTFQFFQLLTGSVTINAFMIRGADLSLDLDEKFLSSQEDRFEPRKQKGLLSWDSLVRFRFRSVGLVDSKVEFKLHDAAGAESARIKALAKEFTVGRSSVDKRPAYNLAVDMSNGDVEWRGIAQHFGQLKASVEISSRGVAVRNFAAQDGESNFHVNGNIRGNILEKNPLHASLAYIARGKVQDWLSPAMLGKFVRIPKQFHAAGGFSAEGKLQADLTNLLPTLQTSATVRLENAQVDGWSIEEATIKADWKENAISVQSLEARLPDSGGIVRSGPFTIDVKKKTQAIATTVELENADLRKLVGPELDSVYPLHMLISGRSDAEIVLGQNFAIKGAADLKIRDFALDNQNGETPRPLKVLLAFPEATIRSKFVITADGVSFEPSEATVGTSKLTAGGKVDAKGFDLTIDGKINGSDIGKLGPFDIRGTGDLHWTITGPTDEVVFTFDVDLADSEYLRLRFGKAAGRVVYNDGKSTLRLQDFKATQGRSEFVANGTIDLGDSERADMQVEIRSGTIQDFAEVFLHFLKESVPWYPFDLTGGMNGVLTVSGKTDLAQLSVEGDMELRNVDLKRELFRSVKLHGGFRRGAYVAENIVVQKKNGWIRGNAVYGADEVLRFDARSQGLSTLDIDHLAALGIPYRAPLAFETRGEGRIDALKGELTVRLGEGVIKSHSVAPSSVAFTAGDGRFAGTISVFGGQLRAKANLTTDVRETSTVELDAQGFDFRPVIFALNPVLTEDPELRAHMTGSARIRFPSNRLSRLTGTAKLDSWVLQKRGYSLGLDSPVSLEAKDGTYAFDNVRFVGEGRALVARGTMQDGEVDTRLTGELDLGIFEFLVHEIAVLKGPAKVDARIFGPAEAPHLSAEIHASGADLRLKSVEQPFEDMRFDVDWRDLDVTVSNAKARFAGGNVSGGGNARIYVYKMPDFDFRLDVDNAKPKVYPVTFARASGRLYLKGTGLPYKVTGSLNVAEALIRENFSLSEGARLLRSSKFLPQKSGGIGEIQIFDLDVDIAAERNIIVRNDLFDGELKGTLKVINSIETPRLLGNASILQGRLLFKDNYFQIQSGNLRFTNPAALDPLFDLTGQTEMKGYKISLVASGAVSDYKIDFQSQPPLAQSDIVNLLTFGMTSSDFQTISRENRTAYSRDEMYNLIFSQSRINKDIEAKLGLKVRLDQSQVATPENAFRPKATTDAPETTQPKVVLQKQITKNLSASVGTTVGASERQERNAGLEYGFGKNVSVIGVYEDQQGAQVDQSRTSVGADLKVRITF